jgi:hypothetical protein
MQIDSQISKIILLLRNRAPLHWQPIRDPPLGRNSQIMTPYKIQIGYVVAIIAYCAAHHSHPTHRRPIGSASKQSLTLVEPALNTIFENFDF